MNIDSIKSKASTNSSSSPIKKAKKEIPDRQRETSMSRKKMWGLTAVALILIIGLWVISLKINIERINKARSLNESAGELSSIKNKFNEVFEQTSQIINRINLGNSTTTNADPLINSTSTTDELTEEQIRKISDTIKSVIPTSSSNTIQP